MNWLKRVFSGAPTLIKALYGYVQSGAAAAKIESSLKKIQAVQPYAEIAARITGDLLATFVPNPALRAGWIAAKAKYPMFFDGKVATDDELNLFRMALATELARADGVATTTTELRLALEAALIDAKAAKLNP